MTKNTLELEQRSQKRLTACNLWLSKIISSSYQLTPLAGDASYRRYFRISQGNKTFILMDAPPNQEDCRPFLHVAELLKKQGLQVPTIIEEDLEQGFLLLSDFGDRLLLNELTNETVDNYYSRAIVDLIKIQSIETSTLSNFDREFMMIELQRFEEWYLLGYLDFPLSNSTSALLKKTYEKLIKSAEEQEQVFIHRDYHSRNLMVTENQSLGLLDFQDAMRGPISYDLISLLKDCYIAWPRERVLEWTRYYFELAIDAKQMRKISFAQFIQYSDWMGMQRHLKAIFIFARLYVRDGRSSYLENIPRVLHYLSETAKIYPEFSDFSLFLNDIPK